MYISYVPEQVVKKSFLWVQALLTSRLESKTPRTNSLKSEVTIKNRPPVRIIKLEH